MLHEQSVCKPKRMVLSSVDLGFGLLKDSHELSSNPCTALIRRVKQVLQHGLMFPTFLEIT